MRHDGIKPLYQGRQPNIHSKFTYFIFPPNMRFSSMMINTGARKKLNKLKFCTCIFHLLSTKTIADWSGRDASTHATDPDLGWVNMY